MPHALIQLNGRWTKKAVAIARHLRDHFGFTKFTGFSTADAHARWVLKKKEHDLEFAKVIVLPDLWRQAIRHPSPDPDNLARLENHYGPLTRYIIADRNIGCRLLHETILQPCAYNRAVERDENVALRSLELLFTTFEDIFNSDRPDVLFCQVIAAAPAYVACAVAQRHGVPFLTLGKTKLDDRHHFSRSALMQPDEALQNYRTGQYKISPDTEKLYRQLSVRPPHTDHYEADLRNHNRRHGGGSWIPLAKHLTVGTYQLIHKTFSDNARIRRGKKLPITNPREPTNTENWLWEWRIKKNYKHLQDRRTFTHNIPKGDFAFFPLSVTPEASTCVFAPYYADQLVAIDACVRSLPLHWKLVVKDHLPMCGRRTPAFYRRMLDTGRVILLDPTIRSTDIIPRARLTVTIASTSGWEALLQGGAVLTLGPVWYLATGLAAYSLHPDLMPEAIKLALHLRDTIPQAERDRRLAAMLQCLLDASFPFSWQLMWQNLTPEQMQDANPTWHHIAKKIHAITQVPIPYHPITDCPWIPAEVTVSRKVAKLL